MKFFMQPQVMNENLKNGLGRWVPVIPADRDADYRSASRRDGGPRADDNPALACER